MKLIIKLVVVMAILLFITIHHTYSKQEKPVGNSRHSSSKMRDSMVSADHFSPSNFILVKLP